MPRASLARTGSRARTHHCSARTAGLAAAQISPRASARASSSISAPERGQGDIIQLKQDLTCRMRFPVPSTMPLGPSSSAPSASSTFTWAVCGISPTAGPRMQTAPDGPSRTRGHNPAGRPAPGRRRSRRAPAREGRRKTCAGSWGRSRSRGWRVRLGHDRCRLARLTPAPPDWRRLQPPVRRPRPRRRSLHLRRSRPERRSVTTMPSAHILLVGRLSSGPRRTGLPGCAARATSFEADGPRLMLWMPSARGLERLAPSVEYAAASRARGR